jgi:hypothetical protein
MLLYMMSRRSIRRQKLSIRGGAAWAGDGKLGRKVLYWLPGNEMCKVEVTSAEL